MHKQTYSDIDGIDLNACCIGHEMNPIYIRHFITLVQCRSILVHSVDFHTSNADNLIIYNS